MSVPAQDDYGPGPGYDYGHGSGPGPGYVPGPADGWPANELEEVLAAALGDPGATARVVEVLSRSPLWVPASPGGDPSGDPSGETIALPAMNLGGAPFVPVFTSEAQFRRCAGDGMPFGVVPAREFARGLPPEVGIAVNPGGRVGVPLPPPLVAEVCRAGVGARAAATGGPGQGTGGRVRLWEPEPADEPVDFLAAAAGEFAVTPVVLSARRALGSVEGGPPVLFVGVELDRWQEEDRAAAMNALGRALGAAPLPWTVNLLLLDVAQDPLADLMHDVVTPFYTAG